MLLACQLQVPYDVCMLHRHIMAEVVAGSYAEQRKPLLGVLYDEIVRYEFVSFIARMSLDVVVLNDGRKEWEDMSGRVGEAFNIVKVASTMDEEALRRARGLRDTLFSKGSSQENQGASKVTFMFLCNATHHILGLRGRSQRLGRSRPGTETEER